MPLARWSLFLVVGLHGAVWANPEPRLVWLEAEQFDTLGGWTNDAQFIDQMGSPYLLAAGLGTPVEDASTRVRLPRAGRYHVWVRTCDWYPECHPGRFRIFVDERPLERVFGRSGQPGWRWERGGSLDLSGQVQLRLRDLTGFYARCDAIVLAPDAAWAPPAEHADLQRLRVRLGGVSPGVREMPTRDVVVIGGGLAGCTAAVAAARTGCEVVLIQNRPVLGGNASTEILVPPVGVWPHGGTDPRDPRETGLVEEYRTAGDQVTAEAVVYSERLKRFVQQEPNLRLFLNTHATGVMMSADRENWIAAVDAIDVRTGQRFRFPGRRFVDCTGDGVIGVAAGGEFRHGKEPRAMYGEPWAPREASRHTMGNTLKYASAKTDRPQDFTAPAWAMEFPDCADFAPGRHPRLGDSIGSQWKIELGGLRDTYADAEAIRDDLLRLIYGIWDHIKNHCPDQRQAARNYRLAWVGHVAGKRESRRLIGDYVLTENDIRGQTLFPDRVAFGGWVLDDHHSAGFFHQGSFGVHYDRPGGLDPCKGRLYSTPYRCLYSRNVENLLMAGRDISASHMALSNTRVMLTCAVIGQAAGTAAGLGVARDATPREVHQNHLEELQQQLLKDGAYLIDLPSRDPRDRARAAVVTASSAGTDEEGRPQAPANVINGFARATGGGTNAWSPDSAAAAPHWLQLAWETPQAFNVVHVVFATKSFAPPRFQLQTFQDGGWETLHDQADVRHRRYVLGLDSTTTDRLRLVCEGRTSVCELRVYDEPPRLVEIARRAMATRELPDREPGLPWLVDVAPDQLPGIVLDARQARQVGRWVHSTFARPYVGDGYLHDGNESKGRKRIEFRPELPAAGRYEIRLAYVPYANRAGNTRVTVASGETRRTVEVDQRRAPEIDGLFHSLGNFVLQPGRQTTITVDNAGSDGYVVVDAVQLLPK